MITKKLIIVFSLLLLISCNSEINSLEMLNSEELNFKNIQPKSELVLTAQEEDDLKFLREEEKMARDVYIYSFDKYGLKIFSNIIDSEKQHMDMVLRLLEKYNIEDPASDIIGEFNNHELQEYYDYLVELSETSVLNAFIAGDIIEDLDILDLTLKEMSTSKPDLLSLYGSLKCGSKNHLISFYAKTLLYGGDYTPEYITQEEFDEIVYGDYEKCGNGN